MVDIRRVVKIEVKRDYVVKGRMFEGYKKIGRIEDVLTRLISAKHVELFFYDHVATLFGINEIPQKIAPILKGVFLPVTVGGGLDDLDKVDLCFRSGVDRVAFNAITFQNPKLVETVAKNYGSQAVVGNIEARKIGGKWCAMFATGREIGCQSVRAHLERLIDMGAGEIVLCSIDNDGMENGFPLDLLDEVVGRISVPVILSGGLTDFNLENGMEQFDFIAGLAVSKAIHSGKLQLC